MVDPLPGVEELGGSEFPITTDDLSAMARAGVFTRVMTGKVELIDGRLVHMAPEHVPHIRAISGLTRALNLAAGTAFSDNILVAAGGTLRINETTAVDPDLMVAAAMKHGDLFRPEDILLVFECAATTLGRDLGLKRRLYAQAGVREYWVADLRGEHLHVFRQPSSDGFEHGEILAADAPVSPLFAPGLQLRLKDFL